MRRSMIGFAPSSDRSAALPPKKGLARSRPINTLKTLHDSCGDHAPGSGGPAGKAFTPLVTGRVSQRVTVCLTGEAAMRASELQDACS